MRFNSHLFLFSTSLPAVFLTSVLMGGQERVGTNKTWSLGSGRICSGDVYMLIYRASLVDQTVKNLPAMQETWVWSLGREDPLEKGMATHSSILWRIPWTEEPGRLQSQKSRTWLTTKHNTHMHVLLSFLCPFNCQPWLFLFLCVTPGDFPNSPVVKILSFQCKTHGFDPWLGN